MFRESSDIITFKFGDLSNTTCHVGDPGVSNMACHMSSSGFTNTVLDGLTKFENLCVQFSEYEDK